MSPKVLQRLAIVLGVLVLAWVVLAQVRRSRWDKAGGLALPKVAPSAVNEVAFSRGADTVVLARQGESWRANGFPGNAGGIEGFLEALGDTTLRSEIVAQSPASHARLGVDTMARRLTIRTGDTAVVDLRVGNRGPDFEGYYVRPEGADAVYLLRGRFAEQLGKGLADWREKQVATIVTDSVARVQVRRGRTSWSMAKSGNVWALTRGPADSAGVARFLSHFNNLRATGFPEAADLDSIRFDPPDRAVTLASADGRPLLALVFDSTSGGAFWVRADTGGPVYRIDERAAELATPAESTLLRK
jgi:hypothetical protein